MTNPRPSTRKGREKGPECGAKNRQGEPCQQPAGWGTDHPGEGRCKLHGGVGQRPTARYAAAKVRPRLGELIEQFSADDNPHDLTHELTLLRALVLDYVERYDETTEALLSWHASFNGDFEMKMRKWRHEVAEYLEQAENERNEPAQPFPTPPYPSDSKPRQMVDIVAASSFIDKIGALSDRIEKRKREGLISMSTLDGVLEQLGVEVVSACQEVGLDEITRSRLLSVIERRWSDIRVDPAAARPGAANRTGQLN